MKSITKRIIERSRKSRKHYVDQMERLSEQFPFRKNLGCSNLAHGFAACSAQDKDRIKLMDSVNIGIITAYNDMLSAHEPYREYPEIIKQEASKLGCTAQVAGAVPAMCDGVTQGQGGMELSLMSRDLIAQTTAIGLSHKMFDAAAYLGVCDKIVPGLLTGALRFGYLPSIFIPAGPMPTGISNDEKVKTRKQFAEGKASKAELLDSESKAYHSSGICTFYGTANTNQLMLEVMGLQLPGSSVPYPYSKERQDFTLGAVKALQRIRHNGLNYTPLYKILDEKTFVNAMVAILATGGSTNHTIHLISMARAAGIQINWDDFSDLSKRVPLIARVYPNGPVDINGFYAEGGVQAVLKELLEADLIHDDVTTITANGIMDYLPTSQTSSDQKTDTKQTETRAIESLISSVKSPFQPDGGLMLMTGNLGRAICKKSALSPEHYHVDAPAVVFESQQAVIAAFESGALNKDCVVIVRGQGPRANGMPELHGLTPCLSVLQDRGFNVALVTDGRMSGASGKILAAIHLCPEGVAEGPISRLRTGDRINIDASSGELGVDISEQEFLQRLPVFETSSIFDDGQELFTGFRNQLNSSEEGATIFRFK